MIGQRVIEKPIKCPRAKNKIQEMARANTKLSDAGFRKKTRPSNEDFFQDTLGIALNINPFTKQELFVFTKLKLCV